MKFPKTLFAKIEMADGHARTVLEREPAAGSA